MPEHDPIPSLERLGDQLERAAARSIESSRSPARAPRSPASPFRGRWLLVPALAGFVVLVLAGSIVLTGRDGGDAAEAAVVTAMKRSSDYSTGRFRLVADLDGRRIEADGQYDTNLGRVEEQVDAAALLGTATGSPGSVPGAGSSPDGRARLVVDRGTVYGALAGPDGSLQWFRLGGTPVGGAATTIDATPADPSAVLDLFGGVRSVTEIGREDVDGVTTTHYRGSLDLDAAYRDLSDADRRRAEESVGAVGGGLPGGGVVPVEVWVDAGGVVRRVASRVQLDGMGASGAPVTATYIIDFTDLGAPVSIDLPDPSSLIELPGAADPGPRSPVTTR